MEIVEDMVPPKPTMPTVVEVEGAPVIWEKDTSFTAPEAMVEVT